MERSYSFNDLGKKVVFEQSEEAVKEPLKEILKQGTANLKNLS